MLIYSCKRAALCRVVNIFNVGYRKQYHYIIKKSAGLFVINYT